ncbi:glycosyltransferase [Falsiroseomonas oryziterrae]|uniref:glycosyltransferase n=1 Tax=Falsiroseomonas oryziterrae TaxID=2911368 RepID=UPI001F2472EE|nr:glycosyltransferase family 2 protein [Roseomonas sp. NPKOSM-4]
MELAGIGLAGALAGLGLVAGVLAAGWLIVSLLATLATALYLRGLPSAAPADPGPFPPVLVLLPIRANDAAEVEDIRGCLAALAAQDYPGPWRAVLVFEDDRDPAFALAQGLDPARFSTLLAGPGEGRSQKVQNLLVALGTRHPEERIVVTLDADTRPQPNWLAELTRPLRAGRAEIASGYRWMLPEDLPSRLAAIADRGPATFARPRALNLLWGGSTAITAEALQTVKIRRVWGGAMSDCLSLTRAAHAAGLPPWTPRRVLVPSPTRHDWASLFAFARRQMLLTRIYAPLAWASLGIGLLLPVLAVLVLLPAALGGDLAAIAVLGLALGLQQWRASMRAEVARRVLPPADAEAVARAMPGDRLLLPVAHLLQLGIFLASAVGREVRWRGRAYAILSPGSTAVLERDQPAG